MGVLSCCCLVAFALVGDRLVSINDGCPILLWREKSRELSQCWRMKSGDCRASWMLLRMILNKEVGGVGMLHVDLVDQSVIIITLSMACVLS